MAGLFSNAVAKSVVKKPKSSKPATIWNVGDPEGDAVGKAVHELKELGAQEKAIKAKKGLFSTIVLKHAMENHIADFCALGVQPATPLKVRNSDGEEVSGTPEMPHRLWLRVSQIIPRLPELKKKIADLEKRMDAFIKK